MYAWRTRLCIRTRTPTHGRLVEEQDAGLSHERPADREHLSLVVGEVVTFATFASGTMATAGGVPRPSFADPGVLRAVVLSGVYLAMVGLIGVR